MNIKILKPLTLRDDTTSQLTSYCCGEIVSADTTLGNQLISCGLAELYEGVVPAGTKNISANGEYDVSEFKTASVNVGTLTVTYDVNGGTGTVQAQTLIAGNSINLDAGSTITPPTGLAFVGWATDAAATEPNVVSPYIPQNNTTLYAVYADDANTYTITYDANGGTGTIDAVAVVAGQSTSLSDGTGLTAPEDKTFTGWATTDNAEEPDVTSPYTPESDITLYAVWTSTPPNSPEEA